MTETVRDPVCGAVLKGPTRHMERSNNTDYYFCSEECRRKFSVNPPEYIPPQA